MFREKFCGQCPEQFYKIAFLCCELNPDKRPSFEKMECWLSGLFSYTSSNKPVSRTLTVDIDNYNGLNSRQVSLSSMSSSNDLLDSLDNNKKCERSERVTKLNKSTEELDESEPIETSDKILNSDCNKVPIIPSTDNSDNQLNVKQQNGFILEIPKSPHLSRDFLPNGDRIRDSIRSRRQNRILKNREIQRKSFESAPSESGDDKDSGFCVSEPVSLTEEERPENTKLKHRPYGEKGFIINMKDGQLSLNNVKNLDNCSDFDSSCDTSLNYVETNVTNEAADINNSNNTVQITRLPKDTNSVNVSNKENASNNYLVKPTSAPSNSAYKMALEDLKRKLNLCKTKLDSLDLNGRETLNASRSAMENYFKTSTGNSPSTKKNDTYDAPMYVRNNKGAIETTGCPTVKDEKIESTSKVYRINDTPLFERRNIRPLSKTRQLKRSDSNENISDNKPNGRISHYSVGRLQHKHSLSPVKRPHVTVQNNTKPNRQFGSRKITEVQLTLENRDVNNSASTRSRFSKFVTNGQPLESDRKSSKPPVSKTNGTPVKNRTVSTKQSFTTVAHKTRTEVEILSPESVLKLNESMALHKLNNERYSPVRQSPGRITVTTDAATRPTNFNVKSSPRLARQKYQQDSSVQRGIKKFETLPVKNVIQKS